MPPQRIGAFGISGVASENAAAGYSTASAVLAGWQGSPGHDRNMLDPNSIAIGIGRACNPAAQYNCYWVTDFGYSNPAPQPNQPYPPGSSTSPTPTPSGTASPVPTPSDTPEPTPTPSPQPQPYGLLWQDTNCDFRLTAVDAIAMLIDQIGLAAAEGACPTIGQHLRIDGVSRLWGDVDCDASVGSVDTVEYLRWLGGLSLPLYDPTCPAPGKPF